jgi:predicted transcriptional regulator
VPGSSEEDVSDEVLEEGCYHLSKMGLSTEQIAEHFEITPAKVSALIGSYESKLKSGEVTPGEIDRVFWEDVKKEAEGDVKLTFLSQKGFHHAWKSELKRLDGPALMSIYESSKDFLSADPNQKFLDFPPPKGYDPLAMDREMRKAVGVIGELLADKWNAEQGSGKKKAVKP